MRSPSTNPLAQPPFLNLMLFRIGITMSYQVFAVAVGWHVFNITDDVLSLGWVGLAEVIPFFCAALVAGHWVDTHSRRHITLGAGVVHTLLAAAVALATHSTQSWTVAFLYTAVGVGGLARAFVRPLYQSLMGSVLPRSSFARGSAISATAFQACLMVGPAISGVLIAAFGVTTAYAVSALFAFIGLVGGYLLKYTYPVTAAKVQPALQSIREGLGFVFNHQVLLAGLSLDMFAVLFGGAVAILPAFIERVLHEDPSVLGLLRAAPAVGSTLIGFVLARFTIDRHAGKWLLASVAAFGLCIAGFGLSRSVPLAFVFLMLSGAFDGVSVIIRSTMVQLCTPDDMRGRVSAISGIFISSSNELGAFESGVSASLLGLVPSIVVGGMITLLVVAATTKLAPKLKTLHMSDLH
ncbi:MFS transporter [Limnobacter litoralis]|uniref:Multidrug efflux pump Tap n=2 Tax=Limnobacter TaxID=131079 RepID=A0ABQ5YPJ1_9BURK|nr:MFS transporter [Limnobacter litoralis]GLR25705.1 MFS transporter [Limnobacter litoralis]